MITKEETPVSDALNRAYEKALATKKDVIIDWNLDRRKFSILKYPIDGVTSGHYYVMIFSDMKKEELDDQKTEVLAHLHQYYYE